MNLDEASGGFEVFRRRAAADKAPDDPAWRIGFDADYRSGFEPHIVRDVAAKLDLGSPSVSAAGAFLVDIGAGSGLLTDALTEWANDQGMTHVVVDAPEMLRHLGERAGRKKVGGRFPDCASDVATIAPQARFFLVYSVLQYVIRDGLLPEFMDALLGLMMPGSVALLGDIPNRDTRARQQSASGSRTGPDTGRDGVVPLNDSEVLQLLNRVRVAGVHSYVLPQPASLALALHREDILLVRPGPYPPGKGTRA